MYSASETRASGQVAAIWTVRSPLKPECVQSIMFFAKEADDGKAEVLSIAFAIRARDSRQSSGVVATLEERFDGLADALEAEGARQLRELGVGRIVFDSAE